MAATRNRVRLKRYIEAYAHDPRLAWSKQLAQQINLTVKSLVETIGEASAGALLRVIDGTRTPRRKLKAKPFLAVSGNVEVSQTLEEVRLHFPVPDGGGLDSATGLDGVDASLVADALTVRASRDAISASISTTQNPLNPTGWNTADHLLLTLTANSTIQSLGTLDASGTRLKRITNVSTGSFTATFQHSTTLRCPAFVNFSLSPGSSVWVYNENGTTEWRVLSVYVSPGITDHGLLTGLDDPNDHAWAILVDGTRPFTGNQSMGNNDLTNWDQLVAQGASSLINLNGGDITGVDDITAAGSGSTWNVNGGVIVLPSEIVMDASGLIDMSGGTIIGPISISMGNAGGSGNIDMNSGNITELRSIDWLSGASVGVPASGRDRQGVDNGAPLYIPGAGAHLFHYPIVARSGTSAGSDIDVAIGLNNISGTGVDLRGGAFRLRVEGMLVPPSDGTSLGHVMIGEYSFYRTDATNTWSRVEHYLYESGLTTSSILVQPLMSDDTTLTVHINLSGGPSGHRYCAVAYLTGCGRDAPV